MKKIAFIGLLALFFFPSFAFADETIDFGTSPNDNWNGISTDSSQGHYYAEPFTPSANADHITASVSVIKSDNPSHNVKFELRSDSSGSPSGTVLGSATVPVSSISSTNCNSPSVLTFPTVDVSLSLGVQYWWVITQDIVPTGITD